ncbi:MAG: hypothetical protein AMXMBFR23_19040 [Chloroflexota bacterium]
MSDRASPHTDMAVPDLTDVRRRTARWLFRAAAVLILVLASLGVTGAAGGGSRDLGALPAFSLPALDGAEILSTSLQGQVVVVNFWASWCPPCRSEAPILAAVAADTAAFEVQFLGVLHQDRTASAVAFAREHGLHFPTVIDDGDMARTLGVRSIPTTFVVGADGTILARHFGPISEARLRVLIEDARRTSDAPRPEGP